MTNKSDYSTDTLLEMCAGNPDCTLRLLDFRPEEDVIKQNGYCGICQNMLVTASVTQCKMVVHKTLRRANA